MTTKITNYVFYNDDVILENLIKEIHQLIDNNKLYKIDFHMVNFGDSGNVAQFDHDGKLIYNLRIDQTFYHHEIIDFQVDDKLENFLFIFNNESKKIQFSKNTISEIGLKEYQTLGQADLKIQIII